ncbi:MAG: methionine ABC transporter permease [Veillonella sp.]|uniref:methionine ABC transporter permease n=1 Tax=Veillonella sp. TaxID=1926307 RepID=UPI00290DAEE5|nr:methionine ABC transporter permease [Veillonella sp.]MDU5733447.1 methionine ABC transporter permease [Veillonella sp.]
MDFFMQELGVPGLQLLLAAEQTLYMVFLSLFIGTVLGLIIAVTLVVTNPNGIVKNSIVYTITNTIVNIVRSVPFIILMVFILPLTKMIVGTRVGTTAAIVPLVIFIAPYLARTAMAGAIGAGGVGDLALTYGYERLNFPLMLFTVVILIIFVQIIQTIGNYFARRARRS